VARLAGPGAARRYDGERPRHLIQLVVANAHRRHRVAPALLGERAGQGAGSRNGPGESGRARNALAASVIGLFKAEQMLMPGCPHCPLS